MQWEKTERGWYTSRLGGILQERDGRWWFFPRDGGDGIGPSKTLNEAKAKAEKREK